MFALQAAMVSLALVGAEVDENVVLLDFYADWSAQCQKMSPVAERLTAAGYPVRRVNVDRERELARRYRVTNVPCFIMVVDGREVERVVGTTTVERLKQSFATAQPATKAASKTARQAAPPAPNKALNIVSANSPATPAKASGSLVTATSGTMPTVTAKPEHDELTERLMRATVRLRIRDDRGRSTGTGTIIDARGGEALVLTCGHVFRESDGQGDILVDLFGPGAPRDLQATLVSYDLKADIGLLSLRTDASLTAAPLATSKPQRGDAVISLGCDHGHDPTARFTRITSLNKFLGPDNIEIAGQPVQGRSGGGLFNAAGELIGVCNAADPADDEGLFAAVSSVQKELKRLGLNEVIAGKADGAIPVVAIAEIPPSDNKSASEPTSASKGNLTKDSLAASSSVKPANVTVAIAPPDRPTVTTATFDEPTTAWSQKSGASAPTGPLLPATGAQRSRAVDGVWQPKWVKKQL